MEIEQILKRVEWLDDERRKEKGALAALEERLVVLEGGLDAAGKQLKELGGELARVGTVLQRLDQIDSEIARTRQELSRSIEDLEKSRVDREREIEEFHRVQLDGVNAHISELRKSVESIARLEDGIRSRTEEDFRLSRRLDKLESELQDLGHEDEERTRSQKLMEERQRRDEKRLTDLQGEVLALRKQLEERRGHLELLSESLRKLENRHAELAAAQADRLEAQASFFEKQKLAQVERDRTWKEWATRFETIEHQAVELDTQIQGLHDTHRDVTRAKETLESTTERMERRINEITEMQRLAEERFRQEWVTFKADDQKRWTNYTLTQEEQQREMNRNLEKLVGQLTDLSDRLQELQDRFQQMDEQTEKRLQNLLSFARDWVADYERTLGRTH